ncbi:hypothetical protein PROFUN_06572 [Planoprotostelium fungivorum]|uniref:BRCT domain-containing protein n=1 Tax=Planoprotostelium fungivorum TaxID=1890364 RepID=A0A2P6MRX7_9EUKA|nr:hypothetical protein PROFUN_06572 [Planoprotostelium fungivorum]
MFRVVSCSSQAGDHPAEDALTSDPSTFWLTEDVSKKAELIVETKESVQVRGLRIVNHGAAFIEIHVRRKSEGEHFEILLKTSTLIPYADSSKDLDLVGRNTRDIPHEKFVTGLSDQKWDTFKIIITQPWKQAAIGLTEFKIKLDDLVDTSKEATQELPPTVPLDVPMQKKVSSLSKGSLFFQKKAQEAAEGKKPAEDLMKEVEQMKKDREEKEKEQQSLKKKSSLLKKKEEEDSDTDEMDDHEMKRFTTKSKLAAFTEKHQQKKNLKSTNGKPKNTPKSTPNKKNEKKEDSGSDTDPMDEVEMSTLRKRAFGESKKKNEKASDSEEEMISKKSMETAAALKKSGELSKSNGKPSKKDVKEKSDDGSDTEDMEILPKKSQAKKATTPKKPDSGSDTDDMEIIPQKPQPKKATPPKKQPDSGSDTDDMEIIPQKSQPNKTPKKQETKKQQDDGSDTDEMEVVKKPKTVTAKNPIERRKSDTIEVDVIVFFDENLREDIVKKQKRIVIAFGGSVAKHFYGSVTHFITEGPWRDDFDEATKERKLLSIVKPSWLSACEKTSERAPEKKHTLKIHGDDSATGGSREEEGDNSIMEMIVAAAFLFFTMVFSVAMIVILAAPIPEVSRLKKQEETNNSSWDPTESMSSWLRGPAFFSVNSFVSKKADKHPKMQN